ncbi:Hypothetical predicted protein [Mytilus galloprovincialis]|uniref:Uncharacterized protein n=2 Tax=Mytilus galloprovincialis TaxID=29158 RepID=A0A8B6FXR5_MYTGA|nr:Hypothetical predicted protein [Mytilus galloprovincialis]
MKYVAFVGNCFKKMVCCYVLLLLCFTVTVSSKGKKDDTKETTEFLVNHMTDALFVLRPPDREKFMRKCTVGQKVCKESDIGDKADIKWVTGISEEAKANFWSSYKCFMHRKEVMCPINGGWTTWTGWGECQAKCGDLSEVKRRRTCMNPVPMNNGLQCFGVNSERKLCEGKCTGPAKREEGELESLDFIEKIQDIYPTLNETCLRHHCTYESLKMIEKTDIKDKFWESLQCYKYQRACPVDGKWSSWSSWSKCSPECGDGFHFRSRECNHPAPSNGGFKCFGKSYREEPCVGLVCPERSEVNPLMSSWSVFHACSSSCGKYGTTTKERLCLNPYSCPNGKKTQKITIEKPCYLGPCPKERKKFQDPIYGKKQNINYFHF